MAMTTIPESMTKEANITPKKLLAVVSNAVRCVGPGMKNEDVPGSVRQFLVSENCTAGDLLTKLAAMQGIIWADPASPPPEVSLVVGAPGEGERYVLNHKQMLLNFASLTGSIEATLRIHEDRKTNFTNDYTAMFPFPVPPAGDPEAPKTPEARPALPSPLPAEAPKTLEANMGVDAVAPEKEGSKDPVLVASSVPGVATVLFRCVLLGVCLAMGLLLVAPGGPLRGGEAPAGSPVGLLLATELGEEALNFQVEDRIPEAEELLTARIRRLEEASATMAPGGEATVALDQALALQQLGDLQKSRRVYGLATVSYRKAAEALSAAEKEEIGAVQEAKKPAREHTLRRQRGRLLFRLGEVLYELGSNAEAKEMLQKARATQESDAEGVAELAATLHQLGNVLRDEGETAEGLKFYEEAKALQLQVTEKSPSDLNEEASLRVDMGHAQIQRGDGTAAGEQFEKAWVLLRKRLHSRREAEKPMMASEKSKEPGFVLTATADTGSQDAEAWERAGVLTSLGTGLRDLGRYPAAKSALEAAAALQRGSGGRDQDPTASAETLTQLSRVYRDEGEIGRSLKLAMEAAELLEKYQKTHPTVDGSTWALASSYAAAADMLREAQRLGEAKAYGEQALIALDALPLQKKSDGSGEYVQDRAVELGRAALQKVLGQVAHDAHLLDVAIGYYSRALEIQARWAGENKSSPREMADTYNLLGTAYQDQGDLNKALDAYGAALKLQEEQVGGAPASVDLSAAYNNVATVLMRMGEACAAKPVDDSCQPAWIWVDEAVSVLEQAVATGEKAELPEHNPELQAIKENLEYAKEKQSTFVRPDQAELEKRKVDASSPVKEQAGKLRSAWQNSLEELAPNPTTTA